MCEKCEQGKARADARGDLMTILVGGEAVVWADKEGLVHYKNGMTVTERKIAAEELGKALQEQAAHQRAAEAMQSLCLLALGGLAALATLQGASGDEPAKDTASEAGGIFSMAAPRGKAS